MARLREKLAAPIVLISAPAGFGKTSLAAELLASLGSSGGYPCAAAPFRQAWLSLDEEDDDPVRFWAAVAMALHRASEDIGTSPFAALTQTAWSYQPPSVTDLASAILEAADGLGGSILLVLDDFHLISSKVVLGAFARFAERLPPGLKLLLLSRSDPRLPLARYRARSLCEELRAQDLRFNEEESETFLNAATGGRLSSAQARAIDRKTEGWAAGLQMAALSLSRRDDPEAFIRSFSGSDRFILDFLVEEVLAAQPPELCDFLLASSLLDRFCASLCEAALGLPPGIAADDIIHSLEGANLFLVPIDDEGLWFRYHRLFAEALRARRRTVGGRGGAGPLPSDEQILLASAAWHESRGELEEAITLLLRAGKRERAADLLDRRAFAILARGERASLEARFAEIGEEAVLARPELAEIAGWVRVFSSVPGETEAFLARAEEAAARLPEGLPRRNLAGALAAMRAFSLCMQGRARESQAQADAAYALLGEDRRFPLIISTFVWGTAARTAGDYGLALTIMEEFLKMTLDWGEAWTMMMAFHEMGTCARYMGRLKAARDIYKRGLDEARRRGVSSFASIAKFHGNYAELLYESDELEAIDPLLEPYITGGENWLLPTDLLVALCPMIRVRIARGRHEEAAALLARAAEIEGGSRIFPRVRVVFRDLRARAAIARGEAADPGAAELVASLVGTADYGEELVAVRQAAEATDIRLLLARGAWSEVAARASALEREAAQGGGMALAIEAGAMASLALCESGDEAEALASLRRALDAAGDEGFLRSFIDLGEGLVPLLDLLARGTTPQGAGAEQASRLLAKLRPIRAAGAQAYGAALVSPREAEVLVLLAEGLSNREMAERLFISEGTVKTHLHHLAEKLGAKNRGSILAGARARRIIR